MGFPVLASCQCCWQGANMGKSPRAEASRLLLAEKRTKNKLSLA